MPRRRLIHLALVLAVSCANVLQAAAGDPAGRAGTPCATATIAVGASSVPQAFTPRLKGGDHASTPGHVLVGSVPTTAQVTRSRADHERAACAARLDVFSRAPVGCRPPPQR